MKDAVAGIERWNKIIEKTGVAVPPPRAAQGVQPEDRPARGRRASIPKATSCPKPTGTRNIDAGCPREADRAFVASLMGRVAEPGKFANWIAPPARGINNQPVDFEYVRFN